MWMATRWCMAWMKTSCRSIPNAPCLEAPMMGVQFGPMADGVGTPDENFGATRGRQLWLWRWLFLDDRTPVDSIPIPEPAPIGTDPDSPAFQPGLPRQSRNPERCALAARCIKVTREEDINIANGDSFVPQVPPPACAGALHTVDVAGIGTDDLQSCATGYNVNGCLTAFRPSTPTDNPTFVDIGGSSYEGQPKPLCDMKLVHVSDRKSIAPGFNLFTDVPLPGRFWGLTVDDLNFSSNPKSQAYGEKLPLAFNPVGIYDYTNRLIYTVESDYNGLWDVLAALHQPHQLPDAFRRVRQPVPFRGQRSRHSRALESELQPAVPHDRG